MMPSRSQGFTLNDIRQALRTTPVGGIHGNIGHGNWANGRYSLKAMYHNTPVRYARRYDEEFDDGQSNTGEVACYPYSGDSLALPSHCPSDGSWPSDDQTVAVFVTM